MRTHRFAPIVALGLAIAACGDSSDPTDPTESPDQGVAASFGALDLRGILSEWVRRAPSEVPPAPASDGPPADPGLDGPLAVHGGTMFLVNTLDANEGAFAGTSPGGPCLVVDQGSFRWSTELTANNVSDIDAALLAGGPVQAELATHHAHSGIDEGPGAYAERVRLSHWSLGTAVTTRLATDSRAELPIPHVDATYHGIDWDLPIASVAGWAAGDSLWIEGFGVAAAADLSCDEGSTSITDWEFVGTTPVVTG